MKMKATLANFRAAQANNNSNENEINGFCRIESIVVFFSNYLIFAYGYTYSLLAVVDIYHFVCSYTHLVMHEAARCISQALSKRYSGIVRDTQPSRALN